MNSAERDLIRTSPQGADVDFTVILRFLISRWGLLAILFVVGAVLGLGTSFLFKNVYRANALLVENTEFGSSRELPSLSGLGGVTSLITGAAPQDKRLEVSLATLQSRALIEDYIRQENLLPILFSSKWDAARNTWRHQLLGEAPTVDRGYRLIKDKLLKVEQDNRTGLIEVSLDWNNPYLAQKWVTDLIALTNTHLRVAAITRSDRNLAFLTAEADKTTNMELRTDIDSLMEEEIRNRMLAQGSDSYAFRYVDPPVLPDKPVFPNRIAFLVLGACAVTLVGSVWLFGKWSVKGVRGA